MSRRSVRNWVQRLHWLQLAMVCAGAMITAFLLAISALIVAESRSTELRHARRSTDYRFFSSHDRQLSDAELWEAKRDLGFDDDEATAFVWGRPDRNRSDTAPSEAEDEDVTDSIGIAARIEAGKELRRRGQLNATQDAALSELERRYPATSGPGGSIGDADLRRGTSAGSKPNFEAIQSALARNAANVQRHQAKATRLAFAMAGLVIASLVCLVSAPVILWIWLNGRKPSRA